MCCAPTALSHNLAPCGAQGAIAPTHHLQGVSNRLAAVFDGHGGYSTSSHLAANLAPTLFASLNKAVRCADADTCPWDDKHADHHAYKATISAAVVVRRSNTVSLFFSSR